MQFVYGFLAAIAIVLFPGLMPARTAVTTPWGYTASFRGLARYFDGPSAQPRTLKLLYVHGMGARKDFTAQPLTDAVAARLKMRLQSKTRVALEGVDLPERAEAPYVNERTYEAANGDRLVVYEALWSPLVWDIKQEKLVREEAGFMADRLPIHGRLKQHLLNERMPDPLLYVGRMGPLIRNAVKQTICVRMLEARIAGDLGSEHCEGVHIGGGVSFAVITESLGSAVAFDAIRELDRDTPAASGDSAHQILARTSTFFMLANQLALLELNSPDRPGGFANVPANGGDDDERSFRFPLEIVTISDPNDVLSYPVPVSLAERYPKHRFVNVRTRLSWKLLGGMAAYPMSAHTGHGTNGRVIQMIAEGWPAVPVRNSH